VIVKQKSEKKVKYQRVYKVGLNVYVEIYHTVHRKKKETYCTRNVFHHALILQSFHMA